MNQQPRKAVRVPVSADELGTFSFDTVDVTGTHEAHASDIDPSLPAEVVARALAARMALPQNVPWSLHDSSGAFLDDNVSIGDQIESGETLTVAPKTHLG